MLGNTFEGSSQPPRPGSASDTRENIIVLPIEKYDYKGVTAI